MNNLPFVYPVPVVLVGVMVNNKANFNTLGNCGIISMEPPIVYISSHKTHHTNKGIRENGHFSLNTPSVDMMVETDYCGIVSGEEVDKSEIFEVLIDENIPYIKSCPVNVLCKVIERHEVKDMEVFYGEVISVYMNNDCVDNGVPDTKKINPLLYMMDNMYYEVGDVKGVGFREGHTYKK